MSSQQHQEEMLRTYFNVAVSGLSAKRRAAAFEYVNHLLEQIQQLRAPSTQGEDAARLEAAEAILGHFRTVPCLNDLIGEEIDDGVVCGCMGCASRAYFTRYPLRAARAQEGNPLANIIGQWPGDETDEEIEAAMQPAREETVGDAIVQGMREAVAFERGEIDATVRQVPRPAREETKLSPESLASLERGLEDMRQGRTVYLGSFAQYANDEEPEPCSCGGTVQLTRERTKASWGSAIHPDAPEVEVEDEFYRCAVCGETFYTPVQAEQHTKKVLKATIQTMRARLRTVEAERDRLAKALADVADEARRHAARGKLVQFNSGSVNGGSIITRVGDLCDVRDAIERIVLAALTPPSTPAERENK